MAGKRRGNGEGAITPSAPKPQVAGSIPVPPAREPRIHGDYCSAPPAQCACFDPNTRPPEASPQIYVCSSVGDVLLAVSDSKRLCAVIISLASSPIIPGTM